APAVRSRPRGGGAVVERRRDAGGQEPRSGAAGSADQPDDGRDEHTGCVFLALTSTNTKGSKLPKVTKFTRVTTLATNEAKGAFLRVLRPLRVLRVCSLERVLASTNSNRRGVRSS